MNCTLNQLRRKKRGLIKKRLYNLLALEGSPQKKGICIKVSTVKPKKPNSAIRKIVRVRLSNSKLITAYIPGQGHRLQKFSTVLVRGGRVKDIPGMRYKLIRGKFDFSILENIIRIKRKSKYGIDKVEWLRRKQLIQQNEKSLF